MIIVLGNGKGGVGKTPTAINLSYALNRAGRRVKMVDIDPQGSLTKYFLDDGYLDLEWTIYHALVDGRKIPAVSVCDGLDFLPAVNGAIPLTNAERDLPQKYPFDFQQRLKKVLKYYRSDDDVVIDTPGNVSIFTVLSLAAADLVVIPVKTEMSAEQATEEIMRLVDQVRGTEEDPGLNPHLAVWGILPTLHEGWIKHHKQVIEVLKLKYGTLVYPEPSKKSNHYNNAHALKQDVSVLDEDLGRYWDRVAASVIAGRF